MCSAPVDMCCGVLSHQAAVLVQTRQKWFSAAVAVVKRRDIDWVRTVGQEAVWGIEKRVSGGRGWIDGDCNCNLVCLHRLVVGWVVDRTDVSRCAVCSARKTWEPLSAWGRVLLRMPAGGIVWYGMLVVEGLRARVAWTGSALGRNGGVRRDHAPQR